MERTTETDHDKAEKTRATKKYLATKSKQEDRVEFAQTQTNNDFNHKTRDRCDSKRHHLKNTKTNETDKVNNKETTAAPVMTVAKVTTTAQVITAMTPREVSTPTATTADVLVNDDNNIIASGVAPPSIAELQGYEAFKNQQKKTRVTTPRKASTPTAATMEVLINADNSTAATSRGPPSRRHKAFVK